MARWIPPEFAHVAAQVRQGQRPRVVVRTLLTWFGFDRRGAQVNRYLLEVMQQETIRCTPALDAVYPDDELEFSSIVPIVVVQPAAPQPAAASAPELPYPVAVFRAIISAQSDLPRRVTTRLDALERTLAYLVFAQLAALRAHAGGQYPDAVRTALGTYVSKDAEPGPPLSFGTWLTVARTLALLAPDIDDPIFASARALVARTAKRPPLGARLSDAIVPLRNRFAHGSNLALTRFGGHPR